MQIFKDTLTKISNPAEASNIWKSNVAKVNSLRLWSTGTLPKVVTSKGRSGVAPSTLEIFSSFSEVHRHQLSLRRKLSNPREVESFLRSKHWPNSTDAAADMVLLAGEIGQAWVSRDVARFLGSFSDGYRAYENLIRRLKQSKSDFLRSWKPHLRQQLWASIPDDVDSLKRSSGSSPGGGLFCQRRRALDGARVLAVGPNTTLEKVNERLPDADVIAFLSSVDANRLLRDVGYPDVERVFYLNSASARHPETLFQGRVDVVRAKNQRDLELLIRSSQFKNSEVASVVSSQRKIIFNDLGPTLGLIMLADLFELGAKSVVAVGIDFYAFQGEFEPHLTLQKSQYAAPSSWNLRVHDPFSNFQLGKYLRSKHYLNFEPAVNELVDGPGIRYAELLDAKFG